MVQDDNRKKTKRNPNPLDSNRKRDASKKSVDSKSELKKERPINKGVSKNKRRSVNQSASLHKTSGEGVSKSSKKVPQRNHDKRRRPEQSVSTKPSYAKHQDELLSRARKNGRHPQVIGQKRKDEKKSDLKKSGLDKYDDSNGFIKMAGFTLLATVIIGLSFFGFSRFISLQDLDTQTEEANEPINDDLQEPQEPTDTDVVIDEDEPVLDEGLDNEEDPISNDSAASDEDEPVRPDEVPEVEGSLEESVEIGGWVVTLNSISPLSEDIQVDVEHTPYVVDLTIERSADSLETIEFTDQLQIRQLVADVEGSISPTLDYEGELENGYPFSDMIYNEGATERVSFIFDVDSAQLDNDLFLVFIADDADLYAGRVFYALNELIETN